MARFNRNTSGPRSFSIQLAPRGLMSRTTGLIANIFRGLEPVQFFDFIAVGGGGSGGGGNWTNNIFGGGGGGGGLAAGTVVSPTSGTITIGGAGSTTTCFGNFGYGGQNGDGGNQPQYMYTAQGGGRSTTGGGNGGNGGKVGQVGVNGPTSAITGVTTNYGGGGGGANGGVAGGAGGGGSGGDASGFPATPNTGGGGGGGRFGGGGAGGSGIVIIRYPDYYPEIKSIAPGLVYTVSVSGGFRRYTFTSGTGTVVI